MRRKLNQLLIKKRLPKREKKRKSKRTKEFSNTLKMMNLMINLIRKTSRKINKISYPIRKSMKKKSMNKLNLNHIKIASKAMNKSERMKMVSISMTSKTSTITPRNS